MRFTAGWTNDLPSSYRWLIDGQEFLRTTNATFVLAPGQICDAGAHPVTIQALYEDSQYVEAHSTLNLSNPAPILFEPPWQTNALVHLRVDCAQQGKTNQILVSTNLRHWEVLLTTNPIGKSIEFTDPVQGLPRFFRVVATNALPANP